LPTDQSGPGADHESSDGGAARAVVDVLYEYAHALDGGDAAACADCFTDDGVWQAQWWDGAAIPDHRFCGRDELVGYFNRIVALHPPWTQLHLVANPRVQVDGDAATATSYFTTVALGQPSPTLGAPPLGPTLGAMGHYVDRLVRGDDRWRFAERTIVARAD